MDSTEFTETKIFQSLANPSRRALFESLTLEEAPVKELTARFNLSQPTVSQHLANLMNAGLVSRRREGTRVYYRVEPRGMKALIEWIVHRPFWDEPEGELRQIQERVSEPAPPDTHLS